MEDPDFASLQAAMDVPVTASLGSMGPLLKQLHSLGSVPKGVSEEEIQLFKEDIGRLCISLKDVSEAEDASSTANWWMKEVRELCYDTQDYLDEVAAHSGVRRKARPSNIFHVRKKLEWRPQIGKKAQARLHKISTISFPKRKNLKRRPQTAISFLSGLMARVEALDDVSERFKLGPKDIKPDLSQAGVSLLTPQLSLQLPLPISVHADTGGRSRVGVEEPMNKLVDLLAFDDDNQKRLKVVTIFGSAGVGKTTLARTIYDRFGGKFQCRAFIRVSRTPDMRRLLTGILSQIKAPRSYAFSDAQDLIDNIREHLEGKRYSIIIDDLWTTPVWNIISHAFPDGDCCSRIITITQINDVALSCCSYYSEHIYEMSPLNDDESRKLFFHRVFGSEDSCPTDIKEVSYEVIRKCGGLPLAITIIASLLASDPNIVMEKWKHIQDSLASTSEGMRDVLYLIYNSLPPHLKTFLLYLSMYPEGHPIGKHDLVEQWVAEGFLGDVEGQDTEEIAESYFDELVSRGMVQAVHTNYDGEVLSCTVHHMVLDLIRNKSMQENFVITVDNFQSTPALPDKVRRLSVQFGGAKGARIPESIIWSQVRSLKFCGFFECVPSIVDYGLLRVLILHIWADEDKIFYLRGIRELFRLRYLKIECNMTIKLPAKIGGLQYLETLEIDSRLSDVPSDIVHLENLLHLRLSSEANLPHGVGQMTSLRTLGYFDLGSNSEDNVMDIGKLTNIQDLHLTCSTVQPAYNLENNMKCLGSILGKLSRLKCLALVPAAGSSSVNTLQGDAVSSSMSISCDGLSSVSPAPVLLERLELPRMCIFPSIPKWFGELSKLCILKIAVRELSMEDIDILKGLAALTALSLYVRIAPARWIKFDEGFPVLKYFKFMCIAPHMYVLKGAMPNVRKIKLGFNANEMKRHRPVNFGFWHLKGLREISVKFWGAGADEPDKMAEYLSDLEAASKHPINVKFVDQTFFGERDQSSVKDETIIGSCTQPESSSHQNPVAEDETIARAMEGGMVSASTGAMDSVLTADPLAALEVGMTALGWVASPIISDLFNKCSSYLSFDESEKLGQLEPKVLLLERAMEVFQSPDVPHHLGPLLKRLKSAFYEAEDILDDVEYYCLEKKIQDDKLKSDGGAPPCKRDWLKKKLQSVLPGSPLKNKETGMLKMELKDSLQKIENIINDTYEFVMQLNLLSVSDVNGSQAVATMSRGAATTSAPPPKVIGRDKDRDKIIAMLHEKGGDGQPITNNGLCYSVIGIHGIGGSGKSTLAQLVCVRERTDMQEKRDDHFDLVMWVHVSQSLSVRAIFKEIFEAATGNSCPRSNSLDVVQDNLEEKLHGKRFLLVLDDVWCNIRDEWQKGNMQQILSPLEAGQIGSKILVTSQSENALSVMGVAKPRRIPISRLDDDVFHSLLMHYALDGAVMDDHVQRRLKDIGVDIAKKLKGSPLAARIVGRRLANRPNAEFWTRVKNGKLLDGTMGALWWSYQHLDQQARRCFAYCSIFPRRHRLRLDELVKLWVAEGFIRSTDKGEDMEDVGREYFDELVSTSFLQHGGKDYHGDYYLIHDLLHDLAETVAGSDCFRVENGLRDEGWKVHTPRDFIPRDVRHLFVQRYDRELITMILQFKNLRTLIIYTVGRPVEKKVTESIFKRLRKLRVLAVPLSRDRNAFITEPRIFSVPISISQLKRLRYLALRTRMCCIILPRTVTKLYHIQLLDFGPCDVLEFPSADLINLRHVFCGSMLKLPDIGNLISLQTIPDFIVRNEQGYEVKQLRHLNKLRGRLTIKGLQNVKSKEEALEANLAAKERLTTLRLSWFGDSMCSPEVQAEVLEGLCPPTGLETLEIWCYKGSRYPNWMVGKQNNGPKDLQELWFCECGQLGPAPKIEAFPHLRSLWLCECSWDALPGNMEHLTSLKKLQINGCINIQSLPTLPQSLERFTLANCNEEFKSSCQTVGHPNWQKIQHIPEKKWEW